MHKKVALIVLPLFLAGLSGGISAAAAPKPGASCAKLGITAKIAGRKYSCTKVGKKLIWSKAITLPAPHVSPKPTPAVSPTPSATPTPTPTKSDDASFYSAKDQTVVHLLNATEGCANPNNATFALQAQVGSQWLPVKVIDSGWNASPFCVDPALGAKNSLAWVKVHMDPGTVYRWFFTGEVNIFGRDGQGHGISASITLPTPVATISPPLNPNQVTLQNVVSSALSAISDSKNAIPTLDPSNSVSISESPSNVLSSFIAGGSQSNFTYLGPTPLLESTPDRTGAVSLITEDHRMAYQSQSALPPWGVGFVINNTDSSGRVVVATSASGASSGVGASNQPYSWRLAFKRDGDAWKYQSISGVNHPSDGVKRFDVVTLGAPGTYSIRLEFTWNTTFYGIGISNPQETVTPLPNATPLRVVILGDSWVYPVFNESGPYHVWDAFPGALSWLSGWNVISAGVPGQGYLATAANETYKDRIVRDLVPENPDLVIFTGSPNDHCQKCSFSDAQIAAEMSSDIQLLQQADPHALIIACSPFSGSPTQSAAMRFEAEALGVPFIDFVNLPLFNQVNNGANQLANGHPTRLGSSYIASELLKEISLLK